MIGRIFGLGTAARQLGGAVSEVAEVFVGNRAEREAADHERFVKSLAQFGEEFQHPATGWFDGMVNGMNRLPRPLMAVGTLGLFSYAMVDPTGFSVRMQGLAYVPEPLWWLLGAIVSFYFGARELHHYRGRKLAVDWTPAAALEETAPPAPATVPREAAPAVSVAAAPVARPAAPPPAANSGARPVVATQAENAAFNAAFEEWRLQTA